jgi:hypothetical protein
VTLYFVEYLEVNTEEVTILLTGQPVECSVCVKAAFPQVLPRLTPTWTGRIYCSWIRFRQVSTGDPGPDIGLDQRYTIRIEPGSHFGNEGLQLLLIDVLEDIDGLDKVVLGSGDIVFSRIANLKARVLPIEMVFVTALCERSHELGPLLGVRN